MSLYKEIIAAYPEITDEVFSKDIIILRNDSDGVGDYIYKWEYSQPIPTGLKLGKPGGN
jgi:hypothetical protein